MASPEDDIAKRFQAALGKGLGKGPDLIPPGADTKRQEIGTPAIPPADVDVDMSGLIDMRPRPGGAKERKTPVPKRMGPEHAKTYVGDLGEAIRVEKASRSTFLHSVNGGSPETLSGKELMRKLKASKAKEVSLSAPDSPEADANEELKQERELGKARIYSEVEAFLAIGEKKDLIDREGKKLTVQKNTENDYTVFRPEDANKEGARYSIHGIKQLLERDGLRDYRDTEVEEAVRALEAMAVGSTLTFASENPHVGDRVIYRVTRESETAYGYVSKGGETEERGAGTLENLKEDATKEHWALIDESNRELPPSSLAKKIEATSKTDTSLPTGEGPEHSQTYVSKSGKPVRVELLKETASDGERLFRYSVDGADGPPMREGMVKILMDPMNDGLRPMTSEELAAYQKNAPSGTVATPEDAVKEEVVQTLEKMSEDQVLNFLEGTDRISVTRKGDKYEISFLDQGMTLPLVDFGHIKARAETNNWEIVQKDEKQEALAKVIESLRQLQEGNTWLAFREKSAWHVAVRREGEKYIVNQPGVGTREEVSMTWDELENRAGMEEWEPVPLQKPEEYAVAEKKSPEAGDAFRTRMTALIAEGEPAKAEKIFQRMEALNKLIQEKAWGFYGSVDEFDEFAVVGYLKENNEEVMEVIQEQMEALFPDRSSLTPDQKRKVIDFYMQEVKRQAEASLARYSEIKVKESGPHLAENAQKAFEEYQALALALKLPRGNTEAVKQWFARYLGGVEAVSPAVKEDTVNWRLGLHVVYPSEDALAPIDSIFEKHFEEPVFEDLAKEYERLLEEYDANPRKESLVALGALARKIAEALEKKT